MNFQIIKPNTQFVGLQLSTDNRAFLCIPCCYFMKVYYKPVQSVNKFVIIWMEVYFHSPVIWKYTSQVTIF